MKTISVELKCHPHQKEVVDYFRRGGKRAIGIWHRKAGKDRVATFIESELSMKRVGLYWHGLPAYSEARRVIWDAITPDGKKLIDVAFPLEMRKNTNNHEMKIELVNGSIWQVVGADNFDSLVGAFPVHVTLSEFAIMHPNSWNLIRPALAMNNGTALFITTPRGYNHAYDMYEHAKSSQAWFSSLKTVVDTGLISAEALAEEMRTMPNELFRQEYYCDFSAANVGSVVGSYLESLEKQGRVNPNVKLDHPQQEVIVSSDIGFRDTSAWWFWVPRANGFSLVDYCESSGMDADDWVDFIAEKNYTIQKIYLPHDAKNRTFATKHTAEERFIKKFGSGKVAIVPSSKIIDRINAARVVLRSCEFNSETCKVGLASLRAWAYDYDERTKIRSREPRHDWASHGGDAFSYGAQVLNSAKLAPPPRDPPRGARTIEEWITHAERGVAEQSRRI